LASKPGGRHIIIVETSQASVVFPGDRGRRHVDRVVVAAQERPERGPEGQAHRVRGDVHPHEARLPSGSVVTKPDVSVPSFGGRLVRKVSVVSALLRPGIAAPEGLQVDDHRRRSPWRSRSQCWASGRAPPPRPALRCRRRIAGPSG
jgi:hypothetical protein